MDFKKILADAHAAARKAVEDEISVRPEDPRAFDCGFAWVTIGGTSALAGYCRKQIRTLTKAAAASDHVTTDTMRTIRALKPEYGDKGYPVGWQWWKPGGFSGQSIRIHEAGAKAFRDSLAEHGIAATVGSRLD